MKALSAMEIHQLVIFWRDKQTRYFTHWHFLPNSDETAHQRAMLIVQAVSKLTRLQIYGAVLDNEAIVLERVKPAPSETIPTMLEISLRPAKRISASNRPITFSILAANSQLCAEVEDGIFSSRLWNIIKQQIIPYLCSPVGMKVSQAANAIISADNMLFYYQDQDQDHAQTANSALASALSQAEREVETADSIYQQFPTKDNLLHKQYCLHYLEQLKHWQQFELSALSLLDEDKPGIIKSNNHRLHLLKQPND